MKVELFSEVQICLASHQNIYIDLLKENLGSGSHWQAEVVEELLYHFTMHLPILPLYSHTSSATYP